LALLTLTMPMPMVGFAVEARHLAEVRQPVHHLADVADADRRAVHVADDHLLQRGRVVELQVQLDQALGGRAHEEAAGQLQVLAAKGRADVLCRYAQPGHAVEVQFHADGAPALAAEPHLADAVDRLQPLLDDVARVLVELLQRAVAAQRQPHHGRRADLHLGDHGRVDVVGRLRSTWLTFACTSVNATSMSLLSSNSMATTDTPGEDVRLHEIELPGMLLTEDSMMLVMLTRRRCPGWRRAARW
jgi:hypothetical protein